MAAADYSETDVKPAANQAQLISTIKAHIAKGHKAAEKAEQHCLAAGLHLKQLKDTTSSWTEWEGLLEKVGISTGRASELMQVADGRKKAETLADASTHRSRKHRSSLRNEEVRLDRAIKVVAAALKGEKRGSVLARLLSPIGMVAVAAKAGSGPCPWTEDDGGRSKSGIPGADESVGDCVARAIAIATQKPYREVHDALIVGLVRHRSVDKSTYGKWVRRRGGLSRFDADHGCPDEVYGAYLESLGWERTATPSRGAGKVHLRADELPPGRLVVEISRHLVAVIDGEIHDTFDSGRAGRVHVKGYWRAAP